MSALMPMDGDGHPGHHPTTPTPPHGGEGEGDYVECGMRMLFHFTTCEKILWNEWNTNTVGAFVASCIGIFIAAFLYEGLRFLREQYSLSQLKKEDNTCAPGCDPPTRTFREGALNKFHIVQTLLYLTQMTFSYLLMLVAMTFNMWLFLSIIVGAFLGYFAFGWVRQKTIDESKNCC